MCTSSCLHKGYGVEQPRQASARGWARLRPAKTHTVDGEGSRRAGMWRGVVVRGCGHEGPSQGTGQGRPEQAVGQAGCPSPTGHRPLTRRRGPSAQHDGDPGCWQSTVVGVNRPLGGGPQRQVTRGAQRSSPRTMHTHAAPAQQPDGTRRSSACFGLLAAGGVCATCGPQGHAPCRQASHPPGPTCARPHQAGEGGRARSKGAPGAGDVIFKAAGLAKRA